MKKLLCLIFLLAGCNPEIDIQDKRIDPAALQSAFGAVVRRLEVLEKKAGISDIATPLPTCRVNDDKRSSTCIHTGGSE